MNVPSRLEGDGEDLVIKDLYIVRRVRPLNVYLDTTTPKQIDHAVFEYGNATVSYTHLDVYKRQR